jgi:enoyl-CoA hydratase/carnithine racemase
MMRPDSWNTPRTMQLLGENAQRDGLEAGTSLTAREALVLGLVSHVADAETAMNYASRLAATIASRGPIATRLAKEAIWRGLEMPLEQALRFETDLTLLLQTTEDRAEGVRAFIEKRAPKFTGD